VLRYILLMFDILVDQRFSLYVRLGNVGSMLGLQYVLGQEWEETERARTAAIKGMTLLL
jgi:hypothetical protein